MRRARGNYYATVQSRRSDGRRFGTEVARQARTLRAAQRAVEDAVAAGMGDRGYVQVWSDSTQRRYRAAERDEAGNWWAQDPFTGTLLPIDGPQAVAS